jgi:hypothetical protein
MLEKEMLTLRLVSLMCVVSLSTFAALFLAYKLLL